MQALDQVGEWPVRSAAVGVVTLGPASRPVTATVGEVDRPFPWASVTKPATALAVLVAVEEGTLTLDDPAGPPGATVRHLLAHASGLGPDAGPPVARPGARRIYSNAGFTVLAGLLADRSAMPFADYLRTGVLEPLGMDGTTLGPVDGAAAAGLTGPLADLLALGREWATPTLIAETTWADAVTVQFPGLAGVLPGFGPYAPCDWGLGVEVRGAKRRHWTGTGNSPRTFGHFGRSGAFLWVDPDVGVVCCGLSARPFGVWAARAWPVLADAVLREVAGGRPDAGPPPSAAPGLG